MNSVSYSRSLYINNICVTVRIIYQPDLGYFYYLQGAFHCIHDMFDQAAILRLCASGFVADAQYVDTAPAQPPPPRPICTRESFIAANRASIMHARHTAQLSFTRTRWQNFRLINKFVAKDAPKGAESSAAIAAMF